MVEGEELEDRTSAKETEKFSICTLKSQKFWSALLLVKFALITQLSSLHTKRAYLNVSESSQD